jgi:eukaryotic-like serine/threonine-protein kinase
MSRNWSRIKALFAEAVEIDPAIRGSWLEERCRDNSEMGREVASLLEHDDSSDRFLETPALQFDEKLVTECDPEEIGVCPGTTIGPWHVLREICSGGMGTVYLGERTIDDEDQPLRQRAAIKIIRARVDAKLFAGRFRRERRILAQLNHPFIARFLEGGTLQNGLPYFALEYVEGERIDDYCRSRQLDRTEILKLFCKVCTAVAYAHRNLVVHRDLKPSNILVAPDGTPRLLDFGIAKLLAVEEESIDQTRGLGPCTPRYSSPEQIRGELVTTGSDIFVLGIILYELVTAMHPFDPANESESTPVIDVLRRICEEEPETLLGQSKKGQSKSGDRGVERLVRGDLQSIIMKALRKRPTERYKSVEHFIDDIQSLLEHRPVLARPQSWWYRSRTLVRRHPTATFSISAAAAVGIVALGFIVASDRAVRRERDYALQQRELAASSARTMISDLASSLESMSAPVERRLELLNRVAAVFDQIEATSRSALDPAKSAVQVRAEVQTFLTLSRALEELGDTQSAIRRSEMAELQARKLLGYHSSGPEDELVLTATLLEECRTFSTAGKMAAAAESLEQALKKLRQVEALRDLAAEPHARLEALLCEALVLKVRLSNRLAKPQEAVQLLTEAIQYGEKAYRAHPSNQEAQDSYGTSLEDLGWLYFDWGRFSLFGEPVRKAMALYRKAVAQAPGDFSLQRRLEGTIARCGSVLALADPQSEEAMLPRESLTIQRRLCALDPKNVTLLKDLIVELGNNGIILASRNQYEEAIKLLKEAVDIGKPLIDEGKGGSWIEDCVDNAAVNLSLCYGKMGDLETARKINLELLAPLTKKLKEVDPDRFTNRFRNGLYCIAQAEVASGYGDWKEAQKMYLQVVRDLEENLRERDYPYDRYLYGYCLVRSGKALAELAETESGCRFIEQGLQIMYALRDTNRFALRAEILKDISEAEEALRRFQLKTTTPDNLATSVTH